MIANYCKPIFYYCKPFFHGLKQVFYSFSDFFRRCQYLTAQLHQFSPQKCESAPCIGAEQRKIRQGAEQHQRRHIKPQHAPPRPHAEPEKRTGKDDAEYHVQQQRSRKRAFSAQHTQQVIERAQRHAAQEGCGQKEHLLTQRIFHRLMKQF